MDYRRWQYEQQQRRKESRKKATNVVIKEMKFRPKIDGHDYTTKMKHVQRFLGEGNKVKLTIMFRGREMAHPELGLKILNKIAEDVAEMAIVESSPRQDGRNMTMVLHPTKKPKTTDEEVGTAAAPDRRRPARRPPRESEEMPKVKTHRGAAKRFNARAICAAAGCSRSGTPPMLTRGLAPRPRGSERPKRSSARVRSMSATATPDRARSTGMTKRARP